MLLKIVLALVVCSSTVNRGGRLLVALYALKLGAHPLTMGLIAATFAIFPTALSWPMGMLVDRFGARWTLTAGSACQAAGALVPFFFPGLAALFAAAALIGLATAFHNVSLHNMIGLLSKPEEQTHNYSKYSLALAISALLGPLLAGFGIDHAGYAMAGVFLAALGLPAVLAPLLWGAALPGATRDSTTSGGNILQTLKDREMLRVLATGGLVVGGIELFQFYMPIYAHSIGLTASATGAVLATYAGAAFAIRLIMRALLTRLSENEVLMYSFYLTAASLLLIPFFHNVVILAVLAFAVGLGLGCGQPITMAMTFRNSAHGRSAEVLGLRIAINQGARVVVPILFGSIGSAFGLFPVFWVFALMLGSGGMLTAGAAQRGRDTT